MATADVIGVPMCLNQDSAYITHWQFHIDNLTSVWHFDIFLT